jgi:hypothetical protein
MSSTDGIVWNAVNTTIFTVQGNGIVWGKSTSAFSFSFFIAVGSGTNTLAYSTNGISWTANNIFSISGNGVAWNGSIFVAVGQGTHTIATSTDGTTWTGRGSTIFTTQGNSICWTGSNWIAVGSGTNTIATSTDGINWIGLGTTCFTTSGLGVAGNPLIGPVVVDSRMSLNKNDVSGTNKLDIVADSYFNNGFTNMSLTINAYDL